MNETGRKLVGKSTSLSGREMVYQTAEGFEVVKTENYEVEELRVFFDDVMMVTIHREVGVLFLVFTGLISLFFIAFALFFFFVDDDTWPASLIFLVLGSPAIVAFLVRAIFRIDVVTIFGRRSKATMRFRIRKQRAREVYEQVCAAVREAQRRRDPVSEP
ncbi:MAG TPA: hypothetical protein VGF28_15350 [Thermoanaerobaculia bacterium]|jgi:hypothetical protein